MRIRTNEDLINYILRQLGAPSLRVELTKDQLQDCIDYAIKEFSTFAYDGDLEETVVLTLNGMGEYQLPDFITSIIDLRSIVGFQNYGANYVPDRWSEQFFKAFETMSTGIDAVISISSTMSLFEKYIMREVNYYFNANKNKLYMTEEYTGNVVIRYTMDYIPDKVDKIFNHQWVKDYATAKARLLQSTVTGKFTAPLVGGSTINYDNMRSLAESEIETLKEELFNKYTGPAPIDIA